MPLRGRAIRTSSASSSASAARVTMCMRAGAALRLRRDRAVGARARRRHLRAVAGPDMVVLRTPVHMRGENFTTVGEFTVSEGERVPFVLTLRAVAPAAAGSLRRRRRRCKRHGGLLAATGRAAARSRATGRDAVDALADHPEGAHLRADRRHRRGADHLAARAASAASATGTTASAGCATRR